MDLISTLQALIQPRRPDPSKDFIDIRDLTPTGAADRQRVLKNTSLPLPQANAELDKHGTAAILNMIGRNKDPEPLLNPERFVKLFSQDARNMQAPGYKDDVVNGKSTISRSKPKTQADVASNLPVVELLLALLGKGATAASPSAQYLAKTFGIGQAQNAAMNALGGVDGIQERYQNAMSQANGGNRMPFSPF